MLRESLPACSATRQLAMLTATSTTISCDVSCARWSSADDDAKRQRTAQTVVAAGQPPRGRLTLAISGLMPLDLFRNSRAGEKPNANTPDETGTPRAS